MVAKHRNGVSRRCAGIALCTIVVCAGCQPESADTGYSRATDKPPEAALVRLRPGANPPDVPPKEVLLKGNPDYAARVSASHVSPRRAAEILENQWGLRRVDKGAHDDWERRVADWLSIHRAIIDGEYLFSDALEKVDYGRVDLSGYYVNCDTGVATIRNRQGTLWIETGRHSGMPSFR